MIFALSSIYKKTKLRTKTNRTLLGEIAETEVGLPQGDHPSSSGWSLVYDHIIRLHNLSGYIDRYDDDYWTILV